jgi:twitching motility protein PilJ
MEARTNEIEDENTDRNKSVGRRKIQGKLLWSFMIIIALTLVVIAITLISQTYARRTINELVQVHSKIARLSLETENTLRVMQGYEKDFLLQHERIGIREAKEKYLDPFITGGGQTYQTLSEIQNLAVSQEERAAAQSATDSINEYLSAFVGTVDILELRVDKEFGELVNLDASMVALGEAKK